MEGRHFSDWLSAFVRNSDHLESPKFVRFWIGVSTIASVLRRRVWREHRSFRWYPNFYLFIVAPPGVISKSTAADLSTALLCNVPDIYIGPSSITWQSLATEFVKTCLSFEYPPDSGEWQPMSAMTLVSREFGSLLDPKNKEFVNFLIELWDGLKLYDKRTKMSGNDIIESPYINLIGATTPSWIADNVPHSLLGGGFISRCVFLYGEKKERLVHNPGKNVPSDYDDWQLKLTQDLEHIAVKVVGPYEVTREADEWEEGWYNELWKDIDINDDRVQGYKARKQTHLNKLAIILSASRSDDRIIDLETMQLANVMLNETELNAAKVFEKIGKSQTSVHVDKLLDYVRRTSPCSYEQAFRYVHAYFPDFNDFEGIIAGIVNSGQVMLKMTAVGRVLEWIPINGSTHPNA